MGGVSQYALEQAPPPADTLGPFPRQALQQTVRILLECIPV